MQKYILLFILILNYGYAISQIAINEASSANSSVIVDEDNDSPDWIELYNTSDKDQNLKSWRIGDKKTFEKAWELPDVTIKSKDRLIIYASDKNYYNSGKIIMRASGIGIFPHAFHDSYRFEYVELTGDFDLSVRVHSLSNIELFASVGLIIREDLTNTNRFMGVLAQNEERNRNEFLWREEFGKYPVRRYSEIEMIYPDVVLQVSRHGDSLIAGIYDYEGYCLDYEVKIWKDFPDTVYAGLALSSNSQQLLAKASFSTLKINDELQDFSILKGMDFDLDLPGKSYFSNEIHTSFKLSRSGEKITLWNDKAVLVDQLEIPKMYVDMSYGRFPDGSDNLTYFFPPTPEKENANSKNGLLNEPKYSLESGFYQKPIEIIINNDNINSKIYYTIDGSEPTIHSKLYNGETLHFDSTTVLKSRAFLDNYIPSEIVTATYFINEPDAGLPTLSFTSDEKYFFDDSLGLFKKPHYGWEHPVSIEYFIANRERAITNRMGVKTHGHGGALGEQTSLRFVSKSRYGESELKYPFFGANGLKTYDKLIIRNSGQDWDAAFLRDAFVSIIGNYVDNVFGTQYQPVMTYLNGKFWGMYNLRERFDDDFLAEKYKISTASISIMEPLYRIMEGSSRTYRDLVDNIFKMEDEEVYAAIDKVIDIDNLVDLSAIKYWANNSDWEKTNYKFWRSSELDNKWRWILMDYDLSLNHDYTNDYTVNLFKPAMDSGKANPLEFHFENILFNAFRSEIFLNKFLNRTCDLLNSTLTSEFLSPILDSLVENIEQAINYQKERWLGSMNKNIMHYNLMRDFFKERPYYYREQLLEFFKLKGISTITLKSNVDSACSFTLNSIKKLPIDWSGYYFNEIPILVTVQPNSGFEFKHWAIGDSVISEDLSLSISLNDSTQLIAVFEKNEEEEEETNNSIVINEIMYKAAKDRDTDDWIELLNASDEDIDLSNWVLKDDDDSHSFIIPEGTMINQGEYLVLVVSSEQFSQFHSDIENFIGEINYGFGKSDEVRLFDNKGKLIDSVSYTNVAPWYPEADGKGPSLELISPDLDNSLPSSWRVSSIKGGTPGRPNSTTSVKSHLMNNFIRIYPNPTIAYANIHFDINYDSNINIKIVDIFGNVVREITNSFYNAGNYSSYWDGKNNQGIKMQSGLYYVVIYTDKSVITEKLMWHE